MNALNKNIPQLRFPGFSGDWVEKKLIELSKDGFNNGVFNDPKKVGSGYKLINVKEMYVGDEIDYNKLTLVDITKKEFEKNKVLKGDILFTRSSLVKEGIAYSNIYNDDYEDVTFDGHLIRMRPKKDLLISKYFSYQLKTTSVRNQLIVRGKTTTMTTIGQQDMATVGVLIPTLSEQEKIADFLSDVDSKIEKLSRKKDLMSEYKKGVMQKIFSQEIRFKDEDGNYYPDWVEKKLGDVCHFFSGGTPTSTNKKYYCGDIPFIKSGEINALATSQFITQEAMDSSSAKLVKKDDLLYALYGATSGTVGISKINGAINQAVLCIRTDESKLFIKEYLQLRKQDIINTFLQGGQGNLSAQIVKKLKINLPCLDEQKKIAEFLTNLDKKIENIDTELKAVKEFKKGLLQTMFV
jgi:type I restriction enzyme S subunit